MIAEFSNHLEAHGFNRTKIQLARLDLGKIILVRKERAYVVAGFTSEPSFYSIA